MRLSVICLILLSTRPSRAESQQQNTQDAQYVMWPWPVATSEKATSEQRQIVAELNSVLDRKGGILLQKDSPGCCLWVDIVNWKPNPGQDAYIVLIEGGGGWIRATNSEQLRLAIHRLEGVALRKNGGTHLPIGLLTNYPLVSSERK